MSEELKIIKQIAAIKLPELGIGKNDPLYDFAVEVWTNGYMECEHDHKLRSAYANAVEKKINDLLK